jgi:hypothetical protein
MLRPLLALLLSLTTLGACSSPSSDPTPPIDQTEQDVKRAPDAGGGCCSLADKPEGWFPEGISCCADQGWHASLGGGESSTCAAHGGVGAVCGAAPGPICGGPPINARCAPCAGGTSSYKQIDGRPSCTCCDAPDDGPTP